MFRTSTALVAAIVLAAGVTPVMPASPAMAQPNPAIDQCRTLLPNRPASNLGECLSYITVVRNDSEGDPSHHCDFLEENAPDIFDLLFTSRSECIQAFGLRGHFH